MSLVKRFEAIKESLENAQNERAEAVGELKQIKQSLKSDFGIDSIEAAQSVYKKMLAQEEKLNEEFEEIVNQLEE